MRIMRFHVVFSKGSSMHRLGSFLRSFGVSREPLLEPGGTHPGLSWVTLPLLGCLGRPLGSLLGPIWCSVGWFCALFGALWRKSGHQLDDFVSLGVKFGFFGGIWFVNNIFSLSLEATGWVCGYWFSRFRSRLNYIMVEYIFFVFLMVEYMTIYLYHLHWKCSWHCRYLCIAFVGNELLNVCKRSSLIDVVQAYWQVYTTYPKYQRGLTYALQS